uniref:(northern house mosquito) hypothetical protein n=1 Tax=Culex pipiens TaxID=7175 RepID=A0A8D8ETS8_CULPI
MERSEEEQVERKISECIDANDWRKVINLGQELAVDTRVKYLWAWPLSDDLETIGACLAEHNISRVLSVGCGTGLLEWLITAGTGILVAGVEQDENWWRSKYATKTYIPMVFAESKGANSINDENAPWHAMMFCYFNHGAAFCDYVNNFEGRHVIIVGPEGGKAVHTDPMPFQPAFPTHQNWKLLQSFRVGSENLNHFVIYQRQ